mgnify:CR=1 FL=1
MSVKHYLFYIAQNYSYAILRPIQKVILARGDNVAWFLKGSEVDAGYLSADEMRLYTINEVKHYNPCAVFVPGNVVPSFIPGLKVAVFHGFNVEKRSNSRGHFNIRGCFDLYCTQGPNTTKTFLSLAEKHQYFSVKETGWSAIDPLYTQENTQNITQEKTTQKKTILMCSTFSKQLSCAPVLFEKIKQLRNSANLTQPELAQAAGIEQSYLSKLENDKGSPSFEVISKLAAALSIDTMSLIESLDENYIKENLAHIPEIAAKATEIRIAKQNKEQRRYIQAAFMIVFGIAAVLLGGSKAVFSTSTYEYYSFGVLKEGEPLEQFTARHLAVIGETHNEREARLIGNRARIDEIHLIIPDYLGEQFVQNVADGRRIYRIESRIEATNHYNDLVLILGVVFIMLGGFTMHYVYRFKR